LVFFLPRFFGAGPWGPGELGGRGSWEPPPGPPPKGGGPLGVLGPLPQKKTPPQTPFFSWGGPSPGAPNWGGGPREIFFFPGGLGGEMPKGGQVFFLGRGPGTGFPRPGKIWGGKKKKKNRGAQIFFFLGSPQRGGAPRVPEKGRGGGKLGETIFGGPKPRGGTIFFFFLFAWPRPRPALALGPVVGGAILGGGPQKLGNFSPFFPPGIWPLEGLPGLGRGEIFFLALGGPGWGKIWALGFRVRKKRGPGGGGGGGPPAVWAGGAPRGQGWGWGIFFFAFFFFFSKPDFPETEFSPLFPPAPAFFPPQKKKNRRGGGKIFFPGRPKKKKKKPRAPPCAEKGRGPLSKIFKKNFPKALGEIGKKKNFFPGIVFF